jgi:thiamine pyrophosphate-dependent acetolactate synthase large subunit-like protein
VIEAAEMLKIFQKYRGDAVVVATGTGGRHWLDISTNKKLDGPPYWGAMGQTVSACLGLAIARPDIKVVLFDSEGSLLMNLGALATVAGKQPNNFYHFLMDNESYATTGGQPVPSAENISYSGMAAGAGYASTHEFEDIEDFANNVEGILSETGPVFVAMKIVAEVQNDPIARRVRPANARTPLEAITELRATLASS